MIVESSRGAPFVFLGGVYEGQEFLQAVVQHTPWRPKLILALADDVMGRAAGGVPWPDGRLDGVPIIKVPSFQGERAFWALGKAEVQGALAVGISEILKEPFLRAFPLGVYGFHASLLPDLAGPAPVNWAIIEGRAQTGTTLLRYSTDIDGGTIVAQASCSIDPRETPATLYSKLTAASVRLWLQTWSQITCDGIPIRPLGHLPQNLRRRPEDGLIRWTDHSAESLDRWVRALSHPYPGAYFWFDRRRVWIHQVTPTSTSGTARSAPMLESVGSEELTVAFSDGSLTLSDLSLDGGATLPGSLQAALGERVGRPMAELHVGRRVLAVVAHPDDEVLGVGGTLIRHFKAGDEVRVLIVCSAQPIRYREKEHDQPGDSKRASHYLGAHSSGLDFPDQRLDAGSNLELIQRLEAVIADFRPETIYAHHWGDVNADHVRIAEAVDVAARPFAAPFLERLFAFETPSSTEWTSSARRREFIPNTYIDISAELDRKIDAMRCYRSELRFYPHPRSLRALRERAGRWGGVANMAAAEPLMLLRSRQ
jgi:N-acetylglucosamine malate deacetylase 1